MHKKSCLAAAFARVAGALPPALTDSLEAHEAKSCGLVSQSAVNF